LRRFTSIQPSARTLEKNMKKLALAAAFAAAASQAFAGGLAPVVITEPPVITEGPMASSGSNLLVPLILIGLIALAASGSDSDS
jgi:hypothetical protein